jgi:hypothetical protein
MSDYNALVYIGKMLLRLLWENISSDNQLKSIVNSDHQITLSSPEDVTDEFKLSLFLYQITKEPHYANQPMKPSGSKAFFGQPLYLNLFYMITPNTKDVEKDQILLGKVAQIFNDNPVLKGPALQGPLAVDGEDIKLIFNPLSLDEIIKIWTVISKSKPYRFSLYYEVTPVRIDSTRMEEVERVVESDVSYLARANE